MSAINTAVLLAAGAGSRLRDVAVSKPLCPVGGRTLIDHALAGLAEAGLTRVVVITGYEAGLVEAHIAATPLPLAVDTVRSPDWTAPNGVSARAAAPLLGARPAVLAMCDHLVVPALYARLAAAGAGQGLRLGIDRRLGHPWVDVEDVTRLATGGDRILAIGKGLEPHDAYDNGVFAVGGAFFAALDRLPTPSITDAVRDLASQGRAEAVDCSDLDWIDVDDARALALATGWVARRAH